MTRQNGYDPRVVGKEVDHGRILLATRSPQGHRTICLPIAEEAYRRIVGDPVAYRRAIDGSFRRMPESFPAGFAQGYQLKDDRMSVKQGFLIRRIVLKDGTAYGVRPSFLLPSMTARTGDVEDSRRPGRREARRRVAERTLSWLSKCRGLLVRSDKHAENFPGLVQPACGLLWYRRLYRLNAA